MKKYKNIVNIKTINDDLERLKALSYGLDDLLNRLSNNLETDEDISKYNKLTTCYLIINEIIKEEDEKNTIPYF